MQRIVHLCFAGFLVGLGAAGCAGKGGVTTEQPPRVEYRERELTIVEMRAGSGEPCTTGQVVKVHYTAWIYKPDAPGGRGTEVDSTRSTGQPFSFRLGGKEVIKGWEMGVIGMRVGGRRTLVIPPHLAYGENGAGKNIPSFAVLVFDVELLGVTDRPAKTENPGN